MRARDNPFSADRVLRVRFRPQGVTWEALVARLEALAWRAAIVGPEGSGKTTLLEDLAPRLKARGFATRWIGVEPVASKAQGRGGRAPLPPLGRPAPGPRDILLVDGADALAWLDWLRLRRYARRAGGLVVTTHRPGRLPTLVECATTPALLAGIVGSLLGPAEAEAWRGRAEELFEKHRGNLREALWELYDLHASRKA